MLKHFHIAYMYERLFHDHTPLSFSQVFDPLFFKNIRVCIFQWKEVRFGCKIFERIFNKQKKANQSFLKCSEYGTESPLKFPII